MTLLLAKLALAPLLVVGASLAARRWGPALAGLLAALPLVAGPILLISDIEHGERFGARAASTSLLAIAALSLFVIVFASTARRGWVLALLSGWAAFLATALALSTVSVPAPFALMIAGGTIVLATRLMPGASPCDPVAGGVRPRWDLPARALLTALLVLSVTSAATALGPTLTGALAPFPIATSVLAAFVLVQDGPGGSEAMLRGFLRGVFGFAVFCFLVAVLLVRSGTLPAFTLALGGALAVQVLMRLAPGREPARSGA